MGKKSRKRGQEERRAAALIGAPSRQEVEAEELREHRRTLLWSSRAKMFLLSYISYAEDGGADTKRVEPRRPDENAEQYEYRREYYRSFKAVQARLGTWPELAAEDLTYIRTSEAADVTGALFGQGLEWCQASGFDPTPNEMRRGAGPLLDGMCPLYHRATANDVLTVLWGGMVTDDPNMIDVVANAHPVPSIHVAAAITTWMFNEPGCVADKPRARMALINQIEKALPYIGQQHPAISGEMIAD